MTNFWTRLEKPFFALAPMNGVTDPVFRTIISRYAPPDVIFTEFANVDALASKGGREEIKKLELVECGTPVVAQLWGQNPANFTEAAHLVRSLGYSGIDINMGCSVKNIIKQNSCGSLITQPDRALRIIEATRKASLPLPISVKTRLGYDDYSEDWLSVLLSAGLDALTIHGRTVTQGFGGTSNWSAISKVVQLKNERKVATCIIGNGDVQTREQGLNLATEHGVDGVMIGRSILSNLFVFQKTRNTAPIDMLEILSEHLALVSARDPDGYVEKMNKYYRMYIRDFKGASELRQLFMHTKSLQQAQTIISRYRTSLTASTPVC